METYLIIMFFAYFAALIYIIPAQAITFDLYERKFRLLPNWFKLVALVGLLVAVVSILIFKSSIHRWEELLMSSFNLSLFLFFFSKQKNEDEFSEQIRFKAFTYSFVSFVAMFGAFGAMDIRNENSDWSSFVPHGAVGAGILIATLYFYITLYKSKKENN